MQPEELNRKLAAQGFAGRRDIVRQGWPRCVSGHEQDDLDWEQEQQDNGEAEEGDGGEEATDVFDNGQLDHLLHRVEVRVVEVSEEPEDAGPENLSHI